MRRRTLRNYLQLQSFIEFRATLVRTKKGRLSNKWARFVFVIFLQQNVERFAQEHKNFSHIVEILIDNSESNSFTDFP